MLNFKNGHKRLRKLLVTAVISLCVMFIATSDGLAQPAAIPPSEMSLLNKGQVVVKDADTSNKVPSVEAKILIPKPPKEVWSVVSNPKQLMQNEPKVKEIKLLSQQGNTQELEYTVFMSKLLPTFNYTLRHVAHPPYTVQFNRLSGSFKDFKGSWKLTPTDNGNKTILTYQLSLDPGPLIPDFLLMNFVKSDLPSMMNNVKAAIDKAAAR